MKQRSVLLPLLMISLSLIACSCANVPDVPICKEITPDRGWCSWTLKSGGFYVDEQNPYAFDPKKPDEKFTWWEIRPVMMSLPPHSWAELKKYIIKQCRITRKCRGNVGEWFNELENKK
jgi:hypothetical protein